MLILFYFFLQHILPLLKLLRFFRTVKARIQLQAQVINAALNQNNSTWSERLFELLDNLRHRFNDSDHFIRFLKSYCFLLFAATASMIVMSLSVGVPRHLLPRGVCTVSVELRRVFQPWCEGVHQPALGSRDLEPWTTSLWWPRDEHVDLLPPGSFSAEHMVADTLKLLDIYLAVQQRAQDIWLWDEDVGNLTAGVLAYGGKQSDNEQRNQFI